MTEADRAFVEGYLTRSLVAMQQFTASDLLVGQLDRMAALTVSAIRAGGKLMLAGNGGSAADSQHIAAEFVSRLMFDRAPLPALALTTDSSALTAIGNDYGFEQAFERQVLGLGSPGDVFLGISTSGTSRNVLRAFEAARRKRILCLGFTGEGGGAMRDHCEILLEVPSRETAIIQQLHITAAHLFCALVERAMFPGGPASMPPA